MINNNKSCFIKVVVVSVFILTSLLIGGCRSTSPPAPPPQPPPVADVPVTPAIVDDIPTDASPAVRAHLIKLREMRDLGQISDGEYQSRKAALVRP